MTSDKIKTYYIHGLHALRSASEQGAQAADYLQARAENEQLKSVMADYAATAARHQDEITDLMGELGVSANGFKDRVMEGVQNGTGEMLKAAEEADLIDMGVISGSQTGMQYYRNAFGGQVPSCKALGLDDQAARWSAMAEEWRALEDRLGTIAQSVISKT